MYRNGSAHSPNGMMRHGGGRGGGVDFGGGVDTAMLQDALKIVPELLRWSTEERRVNDERTAVTFKTQQETIKMYGAIIEKLQRARDAHQGA